jgi:hypothetical protein
MPTVNPTYLTDSNGLSWLIACTNAGTGPTETVAAGHGGVTYVYVNSVTDNRSFSISILPNSQLQSAPAPQGNYPNQLIVQSPNGGIFGIQVASVGGAQGVIQVAPALVVAGATHTLTEVDTWELDNGLHNWPTDRDIPIAWWETTLPQQQIGLAKAPSNDGVIGLLYVALAQTLTGAGVAFAVPDDWTPYIIYGTLAELLSSDGPSFDPVRAGYCSQRYNEGIELARIVLGGM